MEATLEIVYHANSVRITFESVDKAKAAYDKVKTALAEYQRFKNDREETVEVDAEGGASTLKLERMDAVLFNEPCDVEKRWRSSLEAEKKMRDMRHELGLPASPRS